MSDGQRLRALEELVHFRRPIEELSVIIRSLPWDSDGPTIELTTEHVRRILRSFLQNERTADELEFWANCVESREDIWTGPLIRYIVYKLANPELEGTLTTDSATDFSQQLLAGGADLETTK